VTDPLVRSAQSDPAELGDDFPLAQMLEMLEALLRDPKAAGSPVVEAGLGSLLVTADARGVYLEIDAPRLPSVRLGVGSLLDGVAIEARPNVVKAELVAGAGPTHLGVLWLDTPRGDGLAARLIGLALDAAWSRAQVAQSSERLAALDAATRGIANILEVDAVLQLIVERVSELVRARYAALGIVDSVGVIERFVSVGLNPSERERIGHLPRGHGLLGLIIREGRAYRIPEISSDPDSAGFPPHHPPMHSFLGVPITVKGVSVGNLYLTDKRQATEFSEDDQALVEMFALHAGIAIENARLHEQVQRLAIVEERERIAKDLHDGIIQSIYAVGLSLEDLPEVLEEDPSEARARVDRAIDALHMTIRDIRNFIMGLRPELLDQRDLVGSIQALAEETRLNSLIEVETSIDPAAAAALPEHARAPVFHITREALSNIARHSQATRASVGLHRVEAAVRLEINDNGVGFDPDRERPSTHQGLTNMAGRAARHGGRLRVESAAGAGTRIIVMIGAAATQQETR
jgi:signal transduction histidine kinase